MRLHADPPGKEVDEIVLSPFVSQATAQKRTQPVMPKRRLGRKTSEVELGCGDAAELGGVAVASPSAEDTEAGLASPGSVKRDRPRVESPVRHVGASVSSLPDGAPTPRRKRSKSPSVVASPIAADPLTRHQPKSPPAARMQSDMPSDECVSTVPVPKSKALATLA